MGYKIGLWKLPVFNEVCRGHRNVSSDYQAAYGTTSLKEDVCIFRDVMLHKPYQVENLFFQLENVKI